MGLSRGTGLSIGRGLSIGAHGLWDGASGLLDGSGTTVPTIYNSAALATYRTARANRASAPCNIAICGASWEQGYNVYTYGSRWVDLCARNLRTAFPTTGATSVQGSTYWPAQYGPNPGGNMGSIYAWSSVLGSGGAFNNSGIGGSGVTLNTAASGYRYTFDGATFTSFDLYYPAGAGVSPSVFSVSIDGGAAVNINNQTFSGAVAWNSGALSAGTHTVDVLYVSGTNAIYTGFMLYNADEGKGIRTLNGGRGAADSSTTSVFGVYFNDGFLKTANAALCIIDLINNDFSTNVNPATYKTNIQTAITQTRYSAGNSSLPILLMATNYPGDLGPRTYAYSQYAAKLVEVADADALVAVLDLSAYVPPCAYTPATPRDAIGFWDTDYNHPTTYGHTLLGSLVSAALGT